MHIPDAVLTSSALGTGVLALGWVAAVGGTALGLARLRPEEIPRAGLLTSLFFVVSLIQIPLGVTSVHLVLNGLLGLVLGWVAFPAVLVALALQWLLFGLGGLTTLGINTLNMALPGVLCWYLFRQVVRSAKPPWPILAGFATGVLAILMAAALTAICLGWVGQQFRVISWVVWASESLLAIGEGFVTAAAVGFLRRVQPEVFETSLARLPIS